MNKEAYLELADALDSGDYTQTIGQLQKNGSYCVAGVACAVFKDRLGLKHRVDCNGEGAYASPDSEYYDGLIAPYAVKTFLDPVPLAHTTFAECMSLNDFEKQPFPVIADYIRSRVEKA